MRFVLGLGNPGRKYSMTWHNAGFWVADILARDDGARFTDAGLFDVASLTKGFDLVKPTCYMNRSGRAATAFLQHLGCEPSEMLVVCDDVNLPLGRMRLRASGSHGGHNGLRSVIEATGTESFPRLRLGTGPVPAGVSMHDFVLGKVPAEQQERASLLANRAAECVLLYASQGLPAAQERFNAEEEEAPADNPL